MADWPTGLPAHGRWAPLKIMQKGPPFCWKTAPFAEIHLNPSMLVNSRVSLSSPWPVENSEPVRHWLWQSFDIYWSYALGKARPTSSDSEYKLLNKFEFIKAVCDHSIRHDKFRLSWQAFGCDRGYVLGKARPTSWGCYGIIFGN